jgi:hypothetical protein
MQTSRQGKSLWWKYQNKWVSHTKPLKYKQKTTNVGLLWLDDDDRHEEPRKEIKTFSFIFGYLAKRLNCYIYSDCDINDG